jgi:hypothetical protein
VIIDVGCLELILALVLVHRLAALGRGRHEIIVIATTKYVVLSMALAPLSG